MKNTKLEIEGLAEFQSRISDFEKLTEDRMEDASRDIAEFMTDEVSDNAPVDTGELRESIKSVVESVGQAMFKIKIGSDVDQASPIEFGTDPFFPPPNELRGWARRKLGDADLAFPVAKSISETGISEQPYLRPAFKNNVERIVDRIEEALSKSLRDLVKGL